MKVDPYTLMSVEFSGFPKTSEIKPLVRMVLVKYKLVENEKSLSNLAQILILLKKSQKIAEMDVLQHIIDSGDVTLELKRQAAISAVFLAQFKKEKI